jgi:hypothetical protein
VAYAQRAAELSGWKDAAILDTLAAAHAEAGDFGEAVRWGSRAIELQDLKEFRDRLDLFKASRPYHQPPRPAAGGAQ